MRRKYECPRAEKLAFDYKEIVTSSYDPTDNPAGKGFANEGCMSGHPSGKTFANSKKCP